MAAFAGVTLAPNIGLECGGKLWGTSGEGGTQGDPKTGDEFCVTLQPSLVKLDAEIRVGGGFAIAGADNIFGVGPRGTVLPAVATFEEEVRQRSGLSLQWRKTEYFCWEDGIPADAPPGLQLAGQEVGGVFRRGFLCWGVPVGEPEYVTAVLEEKVQQIVKEAEKSLQLLQNHRQAAWVALKWSVWPRFEYWASHCYPSDSIPAARKLDRQLWRLLEGVCGTSIPQVTSRATSSWDCVLPVDMPGREDLTFAAWVTRQPVKLGGMGLRSFSEMCRPAFYGALEQTVPRLHTGFCTGLNDVLGGSDVFGDEATGEGRWRTLLEMDSKLGREFEESWAALRREAEEGAAWLGEEVTGPLTVNAASAGEGCCTGATRAKIVEHRERMMGRLLEEGLLHHRNQEMRPVWSWPERDKLSSQWLLSLPGHDSSLTSDEFTQCVEALLCLPSTACSDVIGEKVGRVRVNRFGDNVVAATLRGDGWRTRHDQVKRRLLSLHKWAGIEVECEVFNLFSGLIPQHGLSRLEAGRKRQGLVPDFRIREPRAQGRGGDETLVLAELKVITSCPTRYQ